MSTTILVMVSVVMTVRVIIKAPVSEPTSAHWIILVRMSAEEQSNVLGISSVQYGANSYLKDSAILPPSVVTTAAIAAIIDARRACIERIACAAPSTELSKSIINSWKDEFDQ